MSGFIQLRHSMFPPFRQKRPEGWGTEFRTEFQRFEISQVPKQDPGYGVCRGNFGVTFEFFDPPVSVWAGSGCIQFR